MKGKFHIQIYIPMIRKQTHITTKPNQQMTNNSIITITHMENSHWWQILITITLQILALCHNSETLHSTLMIGLQTTTMK